jgi:predicted nucleic acid-binding protein
VARVWVVNAAPLISLGKIGHLGLLGRLGIEVIIPAGAAWEIQQGPEWDPARQWVEGDGRRLVTEVGAVAPVIAAWDLGLGESQVLHLCLGEPEREAILDDRAARECAASLGVRVRGTISVLALAKQKGFVTAVRPLLDELVAKGFRIAKPLMDRAAELAGE